jgi:hypothetical protein
LFIVLKSHHLLFFVGKIDDEEMGAYRAGLCLGLTVAMMLGWRTPAIHESRSWTSDSNDHLATIAAP